MALSFDGECTSLRNSTGKILTDGIQLLEVIERDSFDVKSVNNFPIKNSAMGTHTFMGRYNNSM